MCRPMLFSDFLTELRVVLMGPLAVLASSGEAPCAGSKLGSVLSPMIKKETNNGK